MNLSGRQRSKVANLVRKGYRIVSRVGGVVVLALGGLCPGCQSGRSVVQVVKPDGRSYAESVG